jgi:PAS domain S-box-containing protein
MEKNLSVQKFFENADAFMVAIGSDETVLDVNATAAIILGYAKEEIVGKKWFDFFVPADEKADAKRHFRAMLKGTLRHAHSEHSVVTKKGAHLTLNFHNLLVTDAKGKTVGVLSSAEDVTERKHAETAAKKMENRLQISLDFMFEGCQIIDYDWRYVYVNEAAARQGRKPKEKLLGRTMIEAYPDIDKTELFSHLRNCMINRVPHQMDNEFTFADGSRGCFELHIEPVPEGILILSMDITRIRSIEAELNQYRRRLEQVLADRTAEYAKASEELYREIREHEKSEEGLKLRAAVLDSSKEAILLANSKGDFVYANAAASKVYGYTLNEFFSMNIRSLMCPEDVPSVDGFLRRIQEKGQTDLEMIHLRKNKTPIHVKLYSNIIKTVRGQFILVIIQESYDEPQ